MFSLDLEAWLEFVEFVIFTATTSTVWSPVVLTALSTDGSKNPRKKPRSKACMVRKWNGAGARRRGSWWSSMEWGLAPCYLMRSKYNETGGGLGDRTDDELWFFCGMNHCILKYVCFAERRKTTKNWVAISQRLEAYIAILNISREDTECFGRLHRSFDLFTEDIGQPLWKPPRWRRKDRKTLFAKRLIPNPTWPLPFSSLYICDTFAMYRKYHLETID